MKTLDQAIQQLRDDPNYADLVYHAYLGADVQDSVERFYQSSEYQALRVLIGADLQDSTVLDVGAGVGIASVAFARDGAKRVIALEPDRSDLVGLGAMYNVIDDLPVEPLEAFAEYLPLPDESVDLIYGRQVLHHIPSLRDAFSEFARVLRPGGRVIFCREPIAETPEDLDQVLSSHPVHQIAGGEHAYSLTQYVQAFEEAGLIIRQQYDHFSTVINYFPASTEQKQMNRQKLISGRHGRVISRLSRTPVIRQLIEPFLHVYFPGMLYTFDAHKG